MAFLSETGSCVDAEFSRELSSEGSQPHIVARLVERAEASEMQLAQAQQELKALKQVATARAAAEGAGTSAAMSAAQVSHETASGVSSDAQGQMFHVLVSVVRTQKESSCTSTGCQLAVIKHRVLYLSLITEFAKQTVHMPYVINQQYMIGQNIAGDAGQNCRLRLTLLAMQNISGGSFQSQII